MKLKKGMVHLKTFVGLVGTNSNKSTNRKLLQFMKNHFSKRANIEIVEIKDFPLFNKPADNKIPDIAMEVAHQIEEADGVVISTPEYDHSITASLMNALEWLSYGITPFVDKPVMITGASYGTLGSSRAQAHLRQILDSPELKARIMPSSEYLLGHSLQAFDEEDLLNDHQQIEKLEGLFEDFLQFVSITNQLTHAYEANTKEAKNFAWDNI